MFSMSIFIVNQGFIRYKDSIKVFALIKTDFVKSLENTIF